MGERIQVSVVTVCLNNFKGLRAAVASVASQKNVIVEHIVIDGGSMDGTAQWLSDHDPHLIWRSEADGGIAEAMNKGSNLASGCWLLFLQSDDRLADPLALASSLRDWDGFSGLLACPVAFENGRRIPVRHKQFYYRRFKQGIPHQGALIRRDIFERVGRYNESFRVTMDFDWFMRARRLAVKVQVSDRILAIIGCEGISSLTNSHGLKSRLREEQRARLANTSSLIWRLIYRSYGAAYLTFRIMLSRTR